MLPNSSATIRTCGECGALSARRKSSCGVCGASSLSARDARPTPGASWVRVVAGFTCRSCGQRSALDGLDVDGTVTCSACNLTQAFDFEAWSAALEFAHGLADLGRPGQQVEADESANPFAASGETESSFHFERAGLREVDGVVRTSSIFVDASVGHPPCTKCRAPVDVQKNGPAIATSCAACGTVAHYELPSPKGHVAPFPDAVVSDDTRTDGTAARLETDAGGAVAVRCPSCSASLSATTDTLFECTYCRTLCRIPSRAAVGLSADRKGRPFFLAFSGVSLLRGRLAENQRERRKQLESARAFESIPNVHPTPMQLVLKMAFCLLILVLVGLAYIPRFQALFESATPPAAPSYP